MSAHSTDFPTRALPDGRTFTLFPLTFGRWRIGISAAAVDPLQGFVDTW